MRQANVLRLEPTMSQSNTPRPSMAPLGAMLPDSQPSYEVWPQMSQTGGQQCADMYIGTQANPQPTFTSPNRPIQSSMRFRSAFAKQQVARSQSPLGRLSQRSFPRPHNAVSTSQEDTPSQHMSLSQQPSLAFHPAPCVSAGTGHAMQMQQALPLSQLEPVLQSSQHQRSVLVEDLTTHQDSQIERPASATHRFAAAVTSPLAVQTGSQSASATASKLLDQIGQVSSLQKQMSQLTAEVKETMKACEGMAGIAQDVKALTASFQDMNEQLQLIRTDCAEEASKGFQLASKLQETCNHLVTELQKLSANATSSLPNLTQHTQPVSTGMIAQPDQDVQCVSHHVSAEVKQSKSEAAHIPAKRQGIKSRLTEYRRSRAKAAAPVKQPIYTTLQKSNSSAAIQGIYQPTDEPQHAAAQPGRGLSGIKTRYQGREGYGAVGMPVEKPTEKADSMTGGDSSHKSSVQAPSLKLSLTSPKASNREPHSVAFAFEVRKVSLFASSTANGHSNADTQGEARMPAKRHKGQQQSMGLDVFTKLFAEADMVSCQQASTLPVIQVDKIAKEVTERLRMQRMRRMRA